MKRKSLFGVATALLLSLVCLSVNAAPPTDGDFLYDLGSTGPTESQLRGYFRDANAVPNTPRTDGYVAKKSDGAKKSDTAPLLAEGFDPETPDTPEARAHELKQNEHWNKVYEGIRQRNEVRLKQIDSQEVAKKVKCKGGKCGCTAGGECACAECSCSDERIAHLEKQLKLLQEKQEEQDRRLTSGIEGLRLQGEVIKDLLRGLVVAKPALDRREPIPKSNPSVVRLVR